VSQRLTRMNDRYTRAIEASRFSSIAGAAVRATRPGRRIVRAFVLTAAAAASWAMLARPASAQLLPSHPITLLGGRLSLGGDGSVAISTSDHESYFNYGDYQYDTMRLVRLGLAATLRLGSRVVAATEVRSEGETTGGAWRVYPVSLFVAVRPFGESSLTVGAGIVQPAFGAFNERRYGADNLLIGYPIAYQYTTAVRADAIPATADEVVRNRARGWSPHYSIGAGAGVSGLPLVNSNGWSPGVRVSMVHGPFTGAVAVTRGGLAAPGSAAWDGRWEVTGRAALRLTPGLQVGLSAAHGAFIDGALTPIVETAVANRDPRETGFGADVEYSRGYWLLRAETVVSRRTYPAFLRPYLLDPLTAVAVDGEVRYTIMPGLYAAARVGHLAFGSIPATSGTPGWDADVTRAETGLGYSFTRNLLLKVVYQYHRRDSVRNPSLHLGAAELVVKF
jgi:hypothetical protein